MAESPQVVAVHVSVTVCVLVAVGWHSVPVSGCVIVVVDVLIQVGLLCLCLVYGVGWWLANDTFLPI